MQFRKSEKSNLENKKSIFFLIGMVFILSITYAAVNLKSFAEFAYDYQMSVDEDLEELPPVTTPPPPPLPPPPPAKPPVEPIIELVEDEVKTEEPELELEDLSDLAIDDEPIGEEPAEEIEDVPMVRAEQQPYFAECASIPNGPERERCTQRLINKYAQENFQNLVPDIARDMGYSDMIYVKFIVNKQGKVSDVSILKGQYEILNKTAVEAVSKLPQFVPAKNMDRPVSIIYTLPMRIEF